MINLVVALVAESRPLIKQFGLQEDSQARGFRVYRNDHVRLVVTGVGKTAAAAGAAYLGGFAPAAVNEAWLNIGVAGHTDLSLGAAVHALRITDQDSGRSWYPPQIAEMPGQGKTVLTVNEPEYEYNKDVAYDMEAAGFYPTALRFSVGEVAQCYKIVSDNRGSKADNLDKKAIREFIIDHLSAIEQIVHTLNELANDLANTQPRLNDFDHFVARWYFTVTQEHQLRSLLQQWSARAPNQSVWDEALNRCPSAKSLLAELTERINRLPVTLNAQDSN